MEVKLCYDSLQKRPVKRGEQGERNVRPSNERAMSCSGLLVGKARYVSKNTFVGDGGAWLGDEYYKSINYYESFTVKVVKDGIVSYMRDWINDRLKKSESLKQIDDKISKFDPHFQKLINTIRSKLPDLIA